MRLPVGTTAINKLQLVQSAASYDLTGTEMSP